MLSFSDLFQEYFIAADSGTLVCVRSVCLHLTFCMQCGGMRVDASLEMYKRREKKENKDTYRTDGVYMKQGAKGHRVAEGKRSRRHCVCIFL